MSRRPPQQTFRPTTRVKRERPTSKDRQGLTLSMRAVFQIAIVLVGLASGLITFWTFRPTLTFAASPSADADVPFNPQILLTNTGNSAAHNINFSCRQIAQMVALQETRGVRVLVQNINNRPVGSRIYPIKTLLPQQEALEACGGRFLVPGSMQLGARITLTAEYEGLLGQRFKQRQTFQSRQTSAGNYSWNAVPSVGVEITDGLP